MERYHVSKKCLMCGDSYSISNQKKDPKTCHDCRLDLLTQAWARQIEDIFKGISPKHFLHADKAIKRWITGDGYPWVSPDLYMEMEKKIIKTLDKNVQLNLRLDRLRNWYKKSMKTWIRVTINRNNEIEKLHQEINRKR